MMADSFGGITAGSALAAEKSPMRHDIFSAIGAKGHAVPEVGMAVDAARRKYEVEWNKGHKIVLQ